MLWRRQRAIALLISLLFHVFGLLTLLVLGSYQLAKLEDSSREVVFLAYPPMPPVEIGKPKTPAAVPKETPKKDIASQQRDLHPLAQEPPPVANPPEKSSLPPASAEMPLLGETTPETRHSEEVISRESLLYVPSGSSSNGGAYGGNGLTGLGGMGHLGDGSGGTGTGGGEGSASHAGGNSREEREIGANGGPFIVRLNPPVYPKFARRMGKEGRVLLSMLIDETGRLIEVRVIEKAGYGFDEAALEAVRSSLFKPALENGVPISCRARMAIRFQLKDAM